MNDVRREVVGGLAFGAGLTVAGLLIPVLLGGTHAECLSLPGRFARAGDTGTSASCYAVDVAYEFRPFLLWLGLIILAIGVILALLTRRVDDGPGGETDDAYPDDPPEATVRSPRTMGVEPPAGAVPPAVLAADAVRLLADREDGTVGPGRDVPERLRRLLERQLRDVGQADLLGLPLAGAGSREALATAVAGCAEDDPDFARELLICVNSDCAVDPEA